MKDLDKIQKKYPKELAKRFDILYPKVSTIDSVEIVKWRDSIIKVVEIQLDTINSIDTITQDCNVYKSRVNELMRKVKQSYKEIPPKVITVIDSSRNWQYQNKINYLEQKVDKFRSKYELWMKLTACILGLLVISLTAYIIRLYHK